MKSSKKSLVLVGLFVFMTAVAYVVWDLSRSTHPGVERRTAYYQDSMHPWIKSDQPGKCTICAMDLTPIYEGEQGFGAGQAMVVLSSNSVTVLNVQTEEVRRRPLVRSVRVAGTLDANEARKTIISAPTSCRIQSLGFEYAGVEVQQGQVLITLFSPDLVQKRAYLRAVGANQLGGSNTLAVAKSDPYLCDLLAPQCGTVVERSVFPGQYVAEGEKLLTLVDSSVLWFRFDVYERQLPWFAPGQKLEITVPAVPGKVFPAVVAFMEPAVNDTTRTVKIRADIQNPLIVSGGHAQRLLCLGMYAEGRLRAETPDVIAVSRSAILATGGSTHAYVEKGNGAYERQRVKLGRQGDDLWEILDGLDEGDRVVTSGNVLIDAQAQFNQGDAFEDPAYPAVAGQRAENTSEPPSAMTGATETEPMSRRDRTYARMAVSEELRAMRWAAIADAHATNRTETPDTMAGGRSGTHANSVEPTVLVGDPLQKDVAWMKRMAGMTGSVSTAERSEPAGVQVPPLSAEQRQAMLNGIRRAPASLAAEQQEALKNWIAGADAVSQALAADSLEQFNRQVTNLPGALTGLLKTLGTNSPWGARLQRLAGLAKLQRATNLAQARAQFLTFSASVVEFVQQLRKEDATFAGVKVYHCPMAPKPGLWVQAAGPLRNPFYGSEMLTCGKEVRE